MGEVGLLSKMKTEGEEVQTSVWRGFGKLGGKKKEEEGGKGPGGRELRGNDQMVATK